MVSLTWETIVSCPNSGMVVRCLLHKKSTSDALSFIVGLECYSELYKGLGYMCHMHTSSLFHLWSMAQVTCEGIGLISFL